MSFERRFDDVLAAAQHGSEWAWEQVLREIGPGVQAYARAQGAADPEEVLSEVLEGLVRGIARFRGNATQFRSWAFTIAHSRIIDGRRRARRRPQMADVELPDVEEEDTDPLVASEQLSREQALAILADLPDTQRHVVALRVVAGLSVEEAAKVLGKRPGTVRVTMHRALQTLERTMSTQGVTKS